MTKQFFEQQKKQLEEKKKSLEAQLNSFAEKSKEAKGDWSAKMPLFDEGTSLEEEADEVEEFSMLLALEKSHEDELKKINSALERIKKGKYGLCEKCGKPIPQARLKVYPQADYCAKCQ